MIPGLPFSASLATVTLTGVDVRTDLTRLAELSKAYPLVEWGVLLGGRDEPRYPSLEEIHTLLAQRPEGVRMAMHLCGAFAQAWIVGDQALVNLARRFNRIQLNVVSKRTDTQALRDALVEGRHPAVITQHNSANAELSVFLKDAPGHMVLFDASGGRGVSAESWPTYLDGIQCGYAGGLGPDNVSAQLPLIEAAASGHPYWIDMEGKLRTDDWLNLDLCEQVLLQAHDFAQRNDATAVS